MPSPYANFSLGFIGHCAVAVALLVGCAGPGVAIRRETHQMPIWNEQNFGVDHPDMQSIAECPGDWNDISAAVDVAAEQAEMAVLETSFEDAIARWRLVTVTDQPAWLCAHRPPIPHWGSGETITVRCIVGHFGSPSQERRLLERLAIRLRDLRSVETAPIRE